MTKQTYQKPTLKNIEGIETASVLCVSYWTDGSIGDTASDWNNWGEI